MWAFQYKHGDRPLEGYTIQRAAGRGGFGEVYYAVSDSGREIALKAVQGYEQIELRGITQCMNLKSPYLVSIFDVKYNEQGRPFVIMEFVSGPNLRQIMDDSPAGLGTAKAAFFLREIAKGLQYLHDCGIVHRDLKPGNIFFENGYVKIGDYGLSKAISTSQHSGQTVTVGTVHYMAPEIGAGKYDRSIDIYAMGAVLYEMLTGVPPFVGASPTEVLMKHLSAEPDCSNIPEPFCTTIRRAMAKDPLKRFASIQEMVEAVFGAEHIQSSVREFANQDLSMVAGQVAQKVLAGGGVAIGGGSGGAFSPSSMHGPPPLPVGNRRAELLGLRQRLPEMDSDAREKAEEKLSEDEESLALEAWSADGSDTLPLPARIIMAGTATMAIAGGVGLFGNWHKSGVDGVLPALITFMATGSAVVIGLVSSRLLGRAVKDESPWIQRLSLSGPVAVAACFFPMILMFSERGLAGKASMTILATAAALLLVDIRTWVSPTRMQRVKPANAIVSCIIGVVACFMFQGHALIALGILASIGLAMQLLAPWDPMLTARKPEERYALGGLGIKTAVPPHLARGEATPRAFGVTIDIANGTARPFTPGGLPPIPAAAAAPYSESPLTASQYPRVRRFTPAVFLGLFVALVAIGIPFCVLANEIPFREYRVQDAFGKYWTRFGMKGEAIVMLCVGVNALIAAFFALLHSFRKRFRGWWPYAFRPALRLLCVMTVVTCGIVMANADLSAAGNAILTSKIVLAGLTFVLITFVPHRWFDPYAREAAKAAKASKAQQVANSGAPVPPVPPQPVMYANEPGVSPRKRLWATLLAVIGFFGAAGLHRFYVGKIGTGILYLITGGLFTIGTIVDLIMIATGTFTDAEGRKVLRWEDEALSGDKLEAARLRAQTWMGDVAKSVSTFGQSGKVMARRAGGGIVSSLAALFLFAGSVVGLALAADVPGMIDAGRPNPQVKRELLQAFAEMNLVRYNADGTRGSYRFQAPSGTLALGPLRVREESRAGSRVTVIEGQNERSATIAGGEQDAFATKVDEFASHVQDQLQDFDRELAKALVKSAKDMREGTMGLTRYSLEFKAISSAAMAYRDTVKALQETRKALADLEEARNEAAQRAMQNVPAPGNVMVQGSATFPMPVPPPNGAAEVEAPSPPEAVEAAVGAAADARKQSQAYRYMTQMRAAEVDAARARAEALEVEATEGSPLDDESASVAAPLRLMGFLACGTLYSVGIALLMLARRSYGAAHLLRGTLGVACIIGALLLANVPVRETDFWSATEGDRIESVSRDAMEVVNTPPVYAAGVGVAVALILLAWPPRRRREAAPAVAVVPGVQV